MIRLVDFLAIVVLLLAGFWAVNPSSKYIQEVSTFYKDGQITFTRELPHGAVSARWWSEITLIDRSGFECFSGQPQPAYYQQVAGNTVTYSLGAWAKECVDAGPPFYLTNHRQVMLWGFIPLRPTTRITKINAR